jgi:predicted molibdopterin-dependent oxidoreductase YjgC
MRVHNFHPDKTSLQVRFSVDGQEFQAYEGDTIASALYAVGKRAWRRSHSGEPRGLLCGIGHCFDCLVTVDDVPGVRACQVIVQPGMVVTTNLDDRNQVSDGASRNLVSAE